MSNCNKCIDPFLIPKGSKGNDGIDGTNGTDGVDGVDGNDGTNGVNSTTYDSGWKSINNYTVAKGFGLPAFTTGTHPSIRIVDRQVFIEGVITLPLQDSIGAFLPVLDNYMSSYNIHSALYVGQNAGYTVSGAGSSYGGFATIQPIIPTVLAPVINHNIALMESGVCYRRLRAKTAGTFKSLTLNTLLINQIITTDGKLSLSTHANIDDSANASGSNPDIKNTGLHNMISNVGADDYVIEYENYKNSFTPATSGSIQAGRTYRVTIGDVLYGTTTYTIGETFLGNSTATFSGTGSVWLDNRFSSLTNRQYPCAFDGENPATLGGLNVNISTSYLIDEATSIEAITAAFNLI